MLTPYTNQSMSFKTMDSTVYILPNAFQVGNYVMSYRGGYKTFSEMTAFDGTANTYQHSILSVTNFNSFPEITISKSPLLTSLSNDSAMYVADVTTSKTLGFFTFFYDGTNINLKTSHKVL